MSHPARCPACGGSLVLKRHYPELVGARSGGDGEVHSAERLRYVARWLCEGGEGCGYARPATTEDTLVQPEAASDFVALTNPQAGNQSLRDLLSSPATRVEKTVISGRIAYDFASRPGFAPQ